MRKKTVDMTIEELRKEKQRLMDRNDKYENILVCVAIISVLSFAIFVVYVIIKTSLI